MINKTEAEVMENWDVNQKDIPLVTIICITYNHESFISSALDGFLGQETDFPFEIFVHDDASTDNTAAIIRNYQLKFPSIIRPVYETLNQYSKKDGSLQRIILEHIHGKYTAFCEGDDYWCDSKKLQKQADFMKKHPSCSMLLHNGYVENVQTGYSGLIHNHVQNQIMEKREIIREERLHPPTASMFVRSKDYVKIPDFFQNAPVGDRPARMYLMTKGYLCYWKAPMCVHRVNVPGSFSELTVTDRKYNQFVLKGMLRFFDQYNDYTRYEFEQDIQYVKSRELCTYYFKSGNKKKAMHTAYYKKSTSRLQKIKQRILLYTPQHIKNRVKKLAEMGYRRK